MNVARAWMRCSCGRKAFELSEDMSAGDGDKLEASGPSALNDGACEDAESIEAEG